MILLGVGVFLLVLIFWGEVSERRRQRKRDMRHITGAEPWWGRR